MAHSSIGQDTRFLRICSPQRTTGISLMKLRRAKLPYTTHSWKRGSTPLCATKRSLNSAGLECHSYKVEVVGSIPTETTSSLKNILMEVRFLPELFSELVPQYYLQIIRQQRPRRIMVNSSVFLKELNNGPLAQLVSST